jgi:hypothetical protein
MLKSFYILIISFIAKFGLNLLMGDGPLHLHFEVGETFLQIF